MGGLGSGWQGSSAPTVESLRKIDLAALERINLVNAGDQQAIGTLIISVGIIVVIAALVFWGVVGGR